MTMFDTLIDDVASRFGLGSNAQRLAAAVRTSADLAAVRTGSVISTSAFDTLVSEHIDPRPYQQVTTGLKALKAGKLDAFVYDRPILAFNVRKDFRDNVQVLGKVFARENYAVAVPLGSPLRLQIDVAMLEEMRGPGGWRSSNVPRRRLTARSDAATAYSTK